MAVQKARAGAGKVREYTAPAIQAATPFAVDVAAMMRAPKGHAQPSPFSHMAPPSYFGGVPGMQQSRRHKKKKGKREREEREDEGGMWGNMMGVPEHVRPWM